MVEVHVVAQAGFQAGEHADRAFSDLVFGGNLLGRVFLAGLGGRQVNDGALGFVQGT
jgi:hypothetical protein